MHKRIILFCAMVTLGLTGITAPAIAAGSSVAPNDPLAECSSFPETQHTVCGAFNDFWWSNGGLQVFGYPLSEAVEEVDPLTGEAVLVQYFERQRFEWHPGNDTHFTVLLGHLGAQMLDLMGEDWTAMPKAEPSAPHYFAETGFAIAPEFWEYWSGHGIELGDPGISFRESLLLFGYPLSQPREETNADGDTVLTQWFERARFEHHPDNPEPYTVLLGRLGADLVDFPTLEVVATGLNNPRGMAVGPDGAIYVVEAGAGGDECVVVDEGPAFGDAELCFGLSGAVSRVAGGESDRIVEGLPSYRTGRGQVIGPQGIAVAPDGALYVTLGYALHPELRGELPDLAQDLGYVIRIATDGTWSRVVDLAAYELQENPEQAGGIHSNPYALLWFDGGLVATDAAGNNLLQISLDGDVTTLATFPPQMVPAPPGAGLPDGAEVPMASVPTSVARGPDGALYVGEVTGFPFTPGKARIWRVEPGGQAEVYRTGLTAVIGLAFDEQGRLYALEAVRGGLGAVDPRDPATLTGGLLRLTPDGRQILIASEGLIFPSGLLITPEGEIYLANFGMVPGQGTLQRVELAPDRQLFAE